MSELLLCGRFVSDIPPKGKKKIALEDVFQAFWGGFVYQIGFDGG
jgi:hypothetical protein